MTPAEKTCTKCGETKPLDEFNRQKSGRLGRRSRCRECIKAEYRADPGPAIARARRRREENPEKVAEEQRFYRAKSAEKIAETKRRYRDSGRASEVRRNWIQSNREHVREYEREYRRRNAGRINAVTRERRAKDERWAEYMRRYREDNADRIAETTRRWREANPHVWWLSNYKQRCDRYGTEPVVEDFTKADVVERYGDSCFYCDAGEFEHLDHFTPVKDGGSHTLDNVRPSCASCNFAKNDQSGDEWLAEQAELDDLTEDELEAAIDAEIERWTK